MMADPDRTPLFSSMPGVRRDEGAGGKRRRIGEVELVAVRVRNDHEPVAPLPVLHIHAAPLQLRAQGIQHADIERDEHQALAHFTGPLRRENELATLPVDLRDPRFSLLLISPRLREPKLLHVKIDGPVDIRYEQHRPRKPFFAHDVLFSICRDRIRRSANASHKNIFEKLVRANGGWLTLYFPINVLVPHPSTVSSWKGGRR